MISKEQFLLRQPGMPDISPTDPYYYDLCNRLAEIAKEKELFPNYPEKVVERAALSLIGYYQDVICDAGVWRSFISECRRLYNYTLPFYNDVSEEYTDYELNRSDVRFVVWYSLTMNYENKRKMYPLAPEIIDGADVWFEELERVYEESPIPEGYRLSSELELHSVEDRPAIMHLANWLFMHCYLMTPAFAMTLAELTSEYDLDKEEGIIEMQKRLDAAMWQDPTGPLALYLGEWLYLIVEGKPAPEGKEEIVNEHKYYTSFTKFTGGRILQYFATYEEMNNFFIEALGWKEGERHLEQVSKDKDFVLMVDAAKGMLLARNIAKCIADPQNSLYDQEYAKTHAIDLLTERGCCPGDLLRYICKKEWLPDAKFPGSENYDLVKKNWDFIARCYLQQYYRGD